MPDHGDLSFGQRLPGFLGERYTGDQGYLLAVICQGDTRRRQIWREFIAGAFEQMKSRGSDFAILLGASVGMYE